jgi:predicted glycosyltransferase
LVIPLDWGLGHATRCIPIIRELLANGCEVVIAAEGAALSLLKHEFQQLIFIPVTGYRISYSKGKYWLPLKIMSQIPRILMRIYWEHQWIKKIVNKHAIAAIISDNRFGLYHSSLPSVYITHQLLIKTGSRFTEKIGQKLHYWFIKKFNYCWVPDFEGPRNIAGELSHPANLPKNVDYIGGVSRFEDGIPLERKFDLLLLVSGPEPQRTIFEDLLLEQLENFKGKSLLVRGLPAIEGVHENDFEAIKTHSNLTIKNHLAARELNEAILQSELVVCRSGYTTVMDLIKLHKKAIMVPTPGQTEQEYLAGYLMKQHIFYATSQQDFNLSKTLKAVADFSFAIPSFDMSQYQKKIQQFVQSL